jgi:hypothetical protein
MTPKIINPYTHFSVKKMVNNKPLALISSKPNSLIKNSRLLNFAKEVSKYGYLLPYFDCAWGCAPR